MSRVLFVIFSFVFDVLLGLFVVFVAPVIFIGWAVLRLVYEVLNTLSPIRSLLSHQMSSVLRLDPVKSQPSGNTANELINKCVREYLNSLCYSNNPDVVLLDITDPEAPKNLSIISITLGGKKYKVLFSPVTSDAATLSVEQENYDPLDDFDQRLLSCLAIRLCNELAAPQSSSRLKDIRLGMYCSVIKK